MKYIYMDGFEFLRKKYFEVRTNIYLMGFRQLINISIENGSTVP